MGSANNPKMAWVCSVSAALSRSRSVYNYGHVFMWWNRLLGTYKDPADVKQFSAGA